MTEPTDRTAVVYGAIDAFQRTHRLPGLQHAQIRGLLAEHLARVLPLAVPAVPAPATDQAALRDRIAEALYAHDHPGHLVPLNETGMEPAYRESTDAVLSVLPAPADRAAVLREAAGRVLGENRRCTVVGLCQPCLTRTAVSDELRRMADEAQQPEAPAVDRLARIREWVTGDVVTARNEFGNGYREAQRDIRDLLAGREQPAAVQQPKGARP